MKFYYKFLHEELGKVSQVYCALTHCEQYTGDIPSIIDCIESEFQNLKGIYQVDARKKEHMTIVLADIFPQIEQYKKLNNNNIQEPHLFSVNR
ncbi:MAG: hypothetical protein L3J83_10385 [Proteobacteria bacterium]|nr:hypothetical protein [Pseudomonadota bacterium]